MVSIIRALLPMFMVHFYLGESFGPVGAFYNCLYYVVIFNTFMFLMITFIFAGMAIRDCQRLIFLYTQLNHMFSAKKLVSSTKKLLPTINVLCPVSLSTIFYMRKLIHQYGMNYRFRHQVNIPTLVLYIIAVGGYIAFVQMFLKSDNDTDETMKFRTYQQVIAIIDVVIFAFVVFVYMWKLATINAINNSGILIMESNKALIEHLIQFKEYYFKEKQDETDDKEGEEGNEEELDGILCKQYKQIFKKVSQNHIYLFYVNYLTKKFNGNMKVVPEYLAQLQEITSSNIENLSASSCHEKILGFEITFETMNEVATLAFAGAFFVGQLIFT